MRKVVYFSIFVVAGIIGGNMFFPSKGELRDMNRACRELKRGVSLNNLIELFGEPNDSIYKSDKNIVAFGSQKYSVLYSSYIYAKISAQTKEVVQLSCGENQEIF